MNLIDIYIIFHPTAAKYTFFSAVYETLSKIEHISGHKTVLKIFLKNRTNLLYYQTTME
jgi:hypothetical protein